MTCPHCRAGPILERRGKLVCAACHEIVETCCDGAPQSGPCY